MAKRRSIISKYLSELEWRNSVPRSALRLRRRRPRRGGGSRARSGRRRSEMVGIVCRECGNDGRLSRWERKNGTWGCPSCGFINRFDPEAFVSSRRAWMGNVGKAGLAMLGGITGSVSTYLLSRPTRTYSFVGSGGVKFSGGEAVHGETQHSRTTRIVEEPRQPASPRSYSRSATMANQTVPLRLG